MIGKTVLRVKPDKNTECLENHESLSRIIIIRHHAPTYWCSQTKVLVISSPNLPTPPPDYFRL